MYRKHTLFALFYSIFLIFSSPAYAEKSNLPNVIVSIKPFYNLAAAVMEGVATPTLLLTGDASPHDYSLKPSETRQLHQADLIIWGGPNLETFLTKVIQSTGAKNNSLLLNQIEGLTLYPNRTHGNWESHHHADGDHEHHHDHHHNHGTFDPHMWLLPENAKTIVSTICSTLSQLDPTHQAIYETNRDQFISELAAVTQQIKDELAPIKDKPILVFHDAYQYFEHAFTLNTIGAITLNPEIPSSAQRIKEVQKILNEHQVECVYREPQFKPKIVEVLLTGTNVRQGLLDPLGRDEDLGPKGYFKLLRQLANGLRCGLESK